MLKYFILLINLPAVFFLNVFLNNEITITHNLPEQADANSEFIVELVVNKGEVTGFAKIEQQLPNGFKATALETAGASFTFNEGNIKLIWMELPEKSPFSITYKVSVEGFVSGKFPISGNMAYLVNNDKSETIIPEKTITIGNANVKPITATAKRTIIPLNETEYKVEINIKNDGIAGFAKVEEFLPTGVKGVTGIAKDAVFSFVGGKAKFVWMSIPQENEITISYVAVLDGATPEKVNEITGEFSFLENNATKKIPIKTTSDPVSGEILANNEPDNNTEKINENKEPDNTETENNVTNNNQKENTDQKTEKENPTTEPTNIPEPEAAVSYKVQICAGHKQVKNNHFKTIYKYDEQKIATENHEGWIKYTIGKYNQYQEAKAERNDINTGYDLPGPFVAAYNSGKRITVQEALMISSQDWVK